MRVILINPPYFIYSEATLRLKKYINFIKGGNMYFYPFEPPLGLASLTASLKKEGHVTKLVDMPGDAINEDDLKTILSDFSPDLVGISAMTPTIKRAIEIARLSKRTLPSVPVILGGVHPTVSPESVLSSKYVDFVVRGEGEITLATLLNKGLEQPEGIDGLCWKKTDGTLVITRKSLLIKNLNTIAQADYTEFSVRKYIEYTSSLRGIRGVSMMVSRGCPYQCSFCAVKETMGNSWRSLAPEYAAEMMMEICRKFDLEGVWFKDSIFNLLPEWTEAFANYLISHNNSYQFQINSRIDLIKEKEIELLKDAGLTQIDLGIEAGTNKSLKTLNKKISVDQIRASIQLLKKKKVKVSGFFMIGIPGENEDDILETFHLARELELDRASVSIFTPLPGSTIFNSLVSEGKIADTMASFEHHHFTETKKSFCEVPIERLKELHGEFCRYFEKRDADVNGRLKLSHFRS